MGRAHPGETDFIVTTSEGKSATKAYARGVRSVTATAKVRLERDGKLVALH